MCAPAGSLMFLCVLGKECRDPWAEDGAPHALLQQQHGQHEGQECQEVSRHAHTYTNTHLPLPVSSTSLTSLLPSVHLYLSLLTGCLSPLFPARVPSIPWVYFCVFLLLPLPLFALHSPSYTSHTHSEVLSWAEDEVPTKLCACVLFSDFASPRATSRNWQSALTSTMKTWTLAQFR